MSKQIAALAAAVLFFLLSLAKVLFPQAFAPLRSALESKRDAIQVFRELGDRLDLRREKTDEAVQAAQTLSSDLRTMERYVSYRVEESRTIEETQAPEETQMPAVAAFLESQAAFSDYSLPENVDYAYEKLPFDHALPVAGRQSSGFGYRLHPILHTVRFHFGTDVAANAGECVGAFADGTVSFAGYDESFGWHLKIDHGDGWVSHYCHCSKLLVKAGETVSKGDAVALVGATGLATGPHLHFELSHDGVYVNPEYYINE